jgi:peptidoglycan/LPS O-acetylase OafA/YrhL
MNLKIYHYFKNLNGLRFLAAFLVIIHHIEQFKHIFIFPNYYYQPQINALGYIGVTVFFVLSGFLITYILLREKHKTGDVNILSFYIKRVLRIWPLYFLLVLLGFFVFNHIPFIGSDNLYLDFEESFILKLILFILILPNIVLQLFGPVPFISQLWSVGIEEQFYLFWPHLIKRFKNTLLIIVAVWFTSLFSTLFLWYISAPGRSFIQNNELLHFINIVKVYLFNFKIHCMAIGGLGAYLLFYNHTRFLYFIYQRQIQFIIYSSGAIALFWGLPSTSINEQIFSIISILIILNLCSNSDSIISLENKVFNYLGQISYGLYMFHPICIFITIKLLVKLNLTDNNMMLNILIYSISLLLTVVISALSFKYFESYFLKLKKDR